MGAITDSGATFTADKDGCEVSIDKETVLRGLKDGRLYELSSVEVIRPGATAAMADAYKTGKQAQGEAAGTCRETSVAGVHGGAAADAAVQHASTAMDNQSEAGGGVPGAVERWHERMGHLSYSGLERLTTMTTGIGLPADVFIVVGGT